MKIHGSESKGGLGGHPPAAESPAAGLLGAHTAAGFLFLERGGKGEREEEKHRYAREAWVGCLWYRPDQGPNPQLRHVPYWEQNWRPLALQDDTQPTEPHPPGLLLNFDIENHWNPLSLELLKIFLKCSL